MVRKAQVLSVAIAAFIILAGVCAPRASAQNPPPVMSEEYTIDRQVDGVRYVERAVLTNNVYGDFVVEFDAQRIDIPGTRERWTLTFVNHATLDWVEQLEVDGASSYSLALDHLEASPVASIVVGSQSVEIDLVNPCADADIGAYQNLVAQVAADRAVVAAVLEEVDVEEPPGGSGSYAECLNDCDEQFQEVPWVCGNAEGCAQGFVCCVLQAEEQHCKQMCNCDHVPGVSPDCHAAVEFTTEIRINGCRKLFDDCVTEDEECP